MTVNFCLALRVISLLVMVSTLSSAQNTSTANISKRAQHTCENKMLKTLGAKRVSTGSDYQIFLEVAKKFDFTGAKTPEFYVTDKDSLPIYIAGSALFGKGKIVASRTTLREFSASAKEGFMGHELAHMTLNLERGETCKDLIINGPASEIEANGLAQEKIGREPVVAFLSNSPRGAGYYINALERPKDK
jgi:hypothetical protein